MHFVGEFNQTLLSRFWASNINFVLLGESHVFFFFRSISEVILRPKLRDLGYSYLTERYFIELPVVMFV